ncbi:hypothetical protein chiPu_0028183, partial [Chiloscyllium punctatum]|nr:hypothetical protein [Chiloscyllium punctatum]
AYSTLDRRDQNRTLDRTLDRSGDYSEREPLKVSARPCCKTQALTLTLPLNLPPWLE